MRAAENKSLTSMTFVAKISADKKRKNSAATQAAMKSTIVLVVSLVVTIAAGQDIRFRDETNGKRYIGDRTERRNFEQFPLRLDPSRRAVPEVPARLSVRVPFAQDGAV